MSHPVLTSDEHFNLGGDGDRLHPFGEGVLGAALEDPLPVYCQRLDFQYTCRCVVRYPVEVRYLDTVPVPFVPNEKGK